MRQILIHHARRKQARKRGGANPTAEMEDEHSALTYKQADELVALDIALDRLNIINPRQRQVVELRHFGGLSVEETAEVLRLSPITVKRDRAAAKAWLKGQMRPEIFR